MLKVVGLIVACVAVGAVLLLLVAAALIIRTPTAEGDKP